MGAEKFYNELETLTERFENLEPELAVTVRDEEDGIEGYVVVWNTDISVGGPLERMGKGGTRVTPAVTLDEIKMLARIMALKNAAAGLPLGGAKSGLKADSSAPDIEGKYKKFVQLCRPHLFENGGIFGGFGFDIGARPEMPVWACDALGSGRSFTGKPLHMGGTDYDKEGVAGLGVAVAAKTALEHQGNSPQGTGFTVQGIGAMGAAVIKYFCEFGGKLTAVSDPRIGGSWFFDEGASPELVDALANGDIEKTNQLLKDSGFETRPDSSAVLFHKTDIVFPCAVQDVIDEDNAPDIKADMVVEGANNPLSDEARTLLFERGITVIPDFIANPGGIIAAFVELTSEVAPEENARDKTNVIRAKDLTRTRIEENVKEVMDLCDSLKIRPTDAGKYLALRKIFKVS